MRIMLTVVLSLLLVSGIAIAKPEIGKPLPQFNSPILATETEPNDDYTTANGLIVGDAMDAAIDPAGDVDFFSIDVAMGAIIAFQTHPGDVGDTKLYVYDVDGVTQLAYNDDGGGQGYYSLIEYTFADAGTYFVKVTGYSSTTNGTYILTATEEDPPPPPPANDVCEGAIDLQEQGLAIFDVDLADGGYTNASTGGCFSYSFNGPEAFYKIFLTAGEIFTATEDGECDMGLFLFTDCADISGSCLVGSDACCSGAQESITWTVVEDGWYFLSVDTYTSAGCPVTVTVAEPVATDDINWGTMKTLFR